MEKSSERLEKLADVNLITIKNSLVKDQKSNDLIIVVKDKLQSLPPNLLLYKTNSEFILYVCKLVENVILKSDGVNKKELVLKIMREVVGCNDAECKLVGEIIEFLHSNGMIQKIKVVKKFKNSVLSWIKKKVL
jgi:hypothetical protein